VTNLKTAKALDCCAAYVAYWHIATVHCHAPMRSLSEAERTCRGRRERIDVTLMTLAA